MTNPQAADNIEIDLIVSGNLTATNAIALGREPSDVLPQIVTLQDGGVILADLNVGHNSELQISANSSNSLQENLTWNIDGGTALLNPVSTFILETSSTLNNSGMTQLDNASNLVVQESATFTNQAAGTITTNSNATITLENDSSITNEGTISVGATVGNASQTFAGMGTVTSSGTINLGSESTLVIKEGAILVNQGTIQGTNGFPPTLTIESGSKLINNGEIGSSEGMTINVSANATFSGTGKTLSGTAVNFNSGAVLSPGLSPGAHTFHALQLDPESISIFELAAVDGTPGIDSDIVYVETAFLLDGTIQIIPLAGLEVGQYVLFENTEGTQDSVTISTTAELEFTRGVAGFLSTNTNGDRVLLNVTAVPEPTSGLLLGLAAACLLVRRRRRC